MGPSARRAAALWLLLTVACGGAGSGPAGRAAGSSTQPTDRDGSPSWSPDGARIAFYSERDGNAEIYVMNAAGSGLERLTDHAGDEGYPSFSPDCARISFDSDRDGNFEVYTMNDDGTDLRRLTYNPARDLSASWAPDGGTIAFISDRSGRFEVWLMNADGSNQRSLTGGEGQPSAGTHWFPQWSADGEKLTFHVDRDVHTVNIDGSEYTRLTVDPDNGMVPSFAPDGRIVFMSWRGGGSDGRSSSTSVAYSQTDPSAPSARTEP